ncbi:MAG TPA: hypothetical protein VK961_21490 [Chthoniobacter sp.]|nr:hypothetical protein [Chthoniobacter sp.]
MRFRTLLFGLILGASAFAADTKAARPDAQADSFRYDPRFRTPRFASVDEFVHVVESREAPWDILLQPEKSPDYDASAEVVAPGALEVDVIRHSPAQAIVFAQYKANRTAPFSAVIFLLSQKGDRWHVSDFIRRSVGYGSYSEISRPQMLKLRPTEHLHFYFTDFMGGRKWGVDTDEFYMVEGNRLRRTLLLKNDGAFISPADPWREFSQSAQVSVASGRLHVRVLRTWGLADGEEKKQGLAVTFRWDQRRKKFTSPSVGRLFVNDPKDWTSEGLPPPPAGE